MVSPIHPEGNLGLPQDSGFPKYAQAFSQLANGLPAIMNNDSKGIEAFESQMGSLLNNTPASAALNQFSIAISNNSGNPSGCMLAMSNLAISLAEMDPNISMSSSEFTSYQQSAMQASTFTQGLQAFSGILGTILSEVNPGQAQEFNSYYTDTIENLPSNASSTELNAAITAIGQYLQEAF